jgi:hypothetical protein
MAFAAAALTGDLSRAWSIGPVKMEIQSYTVASGDTSGTVTAQRLSRVDHVIVTNLLDVTFTISGTTATLAFADPSTPGSAGSVILIGR